MDEILLRKALATLKSFADNFPKSEIIEEKYIEYYHQLLDDIARETGHDLDYFRIPDGELYERNLEAGTHGGVDEIWEPVYSEHRMCDRDVLLIKLRGSLNFMASFLDAPAKRIIGYTA